jgi:uroporphyrinogen-III synthase
VSAPSLAGLGVLVTRPTDQAEQLCALIESAGGRAIRLPAMAIAPTADPEQAQALLGEPWDLLIFVSRNAVHGALALGGDPSWPRATRLAAIGEATAGALAEAGRGPDLVPGDRFDSESLLALPELTEMSGRRVLIVRGEGGRALLAETLTERGAQVRYAEVYKRVRPELDPAPLLANWAQEVHLVSATSEEILINLLEMLGPAGRKPLLDTPLAVLGGRIADAARRLGFRRVRAADRADDASLVETLVALAREVG